MVVNNKGDKANTETIVSDLRDLIVEIIIIFQLVTFNCFALPLVMGA